MFKCWKLLIQKLNVLIQIMFFDKVYKNKYLILFLQTIIFSFTHEIDCSTTLLFTKF